MPLAGEASRPMAQKPNDLPRQSGLSSFHPAANVIIYRVFATTVKKSSSAVKKSSNSARLSDPRPCENSTFLALSDFSLSGTRLAIR
jgi:hypothetical protein